MIFFFYGDDTYRSYEKTKQIKDKFRQDVDSSGFNTVVLDGENLNLEDFNQAVAQAGFLSNKRLVVIKNIFDNKSLSKIKDDIISYLNKLSDNPEENYLLFWQAGIPDKRNALFKKLNSYKYATEFKPLDNIKLLSWAENEVKKNNSKIAKPALNKLIATTGNNLWHLSQEISKLTAYKKGQTIIEQDVDVLVHGKLDDNIFNLSDALASNQTNRALDLLNQQLMAGANEQYLLAMIIRQFRILLMLKLLVKNNLNQNELAKAANLHPYVVKKTLPTLNKYTVEELKKIFNNLVALDLNIKKISFNKQLLLDLFIIKTGR